MWAVDAVGVGTARGGLGVGGEGDERKTGYDVCRSPFLRRTRRPPTSWVPFRVSPPHSSVERVQAAHIPLERGGAAAAASSLLREQRRW
jgi:hypothetical protein